MTPRFELKTLAVTRFAGCDFAKVMLRDGEILQCSATLFRRAYGTAGTAVKSSTIRSGRGEKLLDNGSQKGGTNRKAHSEKLLCRAV